jgi:hypothetical protein
MKICYYPTKFNHDFKCTTISNKLDVISVYHMWFTREWFKDFILMGVPNNQRYILIEKLILKTLNVSKIRIFITTINRTYISIKIMKLKKQINAKLRIT